MVHVIIQHEVEDYDDWKPVFDDHARTREENGCRGGTLFRTPENPNELLAIFEWDDVDNAKSFVQSEDLREKMQQAGVVSDPEITFLEKIEDFKA